MAARSCHHLCLMHPMDPRGTKLGGIETHVRMILARHPQDFKVLFVGVDEIGDCPLGIVKPLIVGTRQIDFLPVARIPAAEINQAGKTIGGSTTFRFAAGALRHIFALRRALLGRGASADLQRFEFALLPKLLGLNSVQMVHGEGAKDQKMDSLIKKLWFLHRFNETLALHLANHIFCVNPNIIARLKTVLPSVVARAEVMSVCVDTQLFQPVPFDCADDIFRIVFAGRLDEFKDPPLMFKVLRSLHAKLHGKLEFHYAGTSDPQRYSEFAAIAAFTTQHGFQTSAGVSALLGRCHAGILTSYFEGMPCYLLETLATGRPFVAIRLPQYDQLIESGVSGELVERSQPDAVCAKAMIEAFASLWQAIKTGRIDPFAVHAKVVPFSVENQMGRLFDAHRALQRAAGLSEDGRQQRHPARASRQHGADVR